MVTAVLVLTLAPALMASLSSVHSSLLDPALAVQIAELSDPSKLPANLSISPQEAQMVSKLSQEFGGELKVIRSEMEKLEKELGPIGENIDAVGELSDEIMGEIKSKKYDGTSFPNIAGRIGFTAVDIYGDGRADKHGVAILGKMEMDINAQLPDGSRLETGFGPAWTPGRPDSFKDDTDEIRASAGTGGRAGVLLGGLKTKWSKGNFSGTAGFMSFQTSLYTLSGRLSNRPVVYDKNPYLTNILSKAYFENQFSTGVPKRSPEESEFYTMGVRVDYRLLDLLDIMAFSGYDDNFYNWMTPRVNGGMLTINKPDTWGGRYRFIGYNRTNDFGEALFAPAANTQNWAGRQQSAWSFRPNLSSGTPGFYNDTLWSLMIEQNMLGSQLTAEGTMSYMDNSSGVHVQGNAFRVGVEKVLGPVTWAVGGYYIDPNFGTHVQNNGNNLFRVRPDLVSTSGFIHQTVIADPTLPINNTSTYSLGAKFRIGGMFVNMNIQNSQQNSPSDSRIWSSHFLNGSNLNGADWWSLFVNNYIGWYTPVTQSATYNNLTPTVLATYGNRFETTEPFFTNNPRAESGNVKLDDYNNTYVPQDTIIQSKDSKYLYGAYHQLETGTWRMNYEGFVVSDPVTGLALPASTKSISTASIDTRVDLDDWFGIFGNHVFWQTYGEITTVNDTGLFMPSLDPSNLFVQSILDTTIAVNPIDNVVLSLSMGIEEWRSDRTVRDFTNMRGEQVKGTLEYHDRTAGVGLDWNIRPNKLAFYMRAKLVYHHDSSATSNDFVARQTMFEIKSFF